MLPIWGKVNEIFRTQGVLMKIQFNTSVLGVSLLLSFWTGARAEERIVEQRVSISSEEGVDFLTVADDQKRPTKYFVIQNVATETTRVYERCTTSPDCSHRLVFESEMVVGRRKIDFVDPMEWYTQLGVMNIHHWDKFHEDADHHYPAWYSSRYPAVPPPGADFQDWFSKEVMPNGKGVMRGAFGWFTAILAPNAAHQWVHGTAGWGADGDRFIEVTRNFLLSTFNDVRSSGCTRIENGAIAFLRHILPIGTPVIRVYAKEAMQEPDLKDYTQQKTKDPFYYILTRTDKINDQTAGTIERQAVLARKVQSSDWIEEGLYTVDRFPTVRPYRSTPGWIGAGSGAIGNVYRVPFYEFEGYYLIDSGRFVNYQHPKSLPVGGLAGVIVPDYTLAAPSVEPKEPLNYQE